MHVSQTFSVSASSERWDILAVSHIHTKKAFTMCVNAQSFGKLNTLGLKLETVEQLQENKWCH